MKIEDLMTRDPRTVRPEDSARAAAQAMWEQDCGVLPVVDGGGQLVGMITDRDVCMAAYTRGTSLDRIGVQDTMAKDVTVCRPNEDLGAAEERMRSRQVRRLPVVDEQRRLLGILSLNDLAREAAREQGRKQKDLSPEDVALTLAAVCEPRVLVTAGATR